MFQRRKYQRFLEYNPWLFFVRIKFKSPSRKKIKIKDLLFLSYLVICNSFLLYTSRKCFHLWKRLSFCSTSNNCDFRAGGLPQTGMRSKCPVGKVWSPGQTQSTGKTKSTEAASIRYKADISAECKRRNKTFSLGHEMIISAFIYESNIKKQKQRLAGTQVQNFTMGSWPAISGTHVTH